MNVRPPSGAQMGLRPEDLEGLRAELARGHVQSAYSAIIGYMSQLRGRYSSGEWPVSGLYQGQFDMTYFAEPATGSATGSGPSISDEESGGTWAVIAQHMLEYAWVPLDAAGADLLALEDALLEQGIDCAFLPYRPGESGGFTEAMRQPLQLLVASRDEERALEVAFDVLGSDSDLIVGADG